MKLETENLYDTIANNYWKMEKEDLKNIILELIFYSDEEEIKEAVESYNNIGEKHYDEMEELV